ncbi:hypothetical protein HNQ38_001683 [Desulfovibrio intestinalis]|uniref:Uncharacterized protein n=1 Tax=Desulfovibrio intestinalis TaxID=58621 RepID=A0A7W8FG51_9BACT|nr:hypothetical protein [Desulfovibrio intestinalis]
MYSANKCNIMLLNNFSFHFSVWFYDIVVKKQMRNTECRATTPFLYMRNDTMFCPTVQSSSIPMR